MAFDNLVSRVDAAPLIPEDRFLGMLGAIKDESAAFSLFRRVPVSRGQLRIPVLSALPIAYFVSPTDTGQVETSEANWKNVYLNIEEIAVIVPVPDNVVADSELDIWSEMERPIAQAVSRCFDGAAFFGTNAPSSWPDDISTAAASAANTNAEGDSAATGGFMGDLDDTLALLEADGFDSAGWVMARNAKAKFRAARSTLGEQLDRDRLSPKLDELDGEPIVYPMRGLFPSTTRGFVGDWTQFALGIRSDISMEVSREAVIQDNTGAIVFNTFQQNLTALKVTFRAGWAVANTINYDQPTEASRYPAAIQTY